MYRKQPTGEELSQYGLTFDDIAADWSIELLPENEKVFEIFKALRTQWRNQNGIDYNVIPFVLSNMKIRKSMWAEIFKDLQIMEIAAITEMWKE